MFSCPCRSDHTCTQCASACSRPHARNTHTFNPPLSCKVRVRFCIHSPSHLPFYSPPRALMKSTMSHRTRYGMDNSPTAEAITPLRLTHAFSQSLFTSTRTQSLSLDLSRAHKVQARRHSQAQTLVHSNNRSPPPFSLHPSIHASTHPSFPPSLLHSLPPFLLTSLPTSLPPSLPHSLASLSTCLSFSMSAFFP